MAEAIVKVFVFMFTLLLFDASSVPFRNRRACRGVVDPNL